MPRVKVEPRQEEDTRRYSNLPEVISAAGPRYTKSPYILFTEDWHTASEAGESRREITEDSG